MPGQPPAGLGKKESPLGLFMGRLADDNHIIVLQALLRNLKSEKITAHWSKEFALHLCRDIEVDTQQLLDGARERWTEYQKHWYSLLSNKELGPLFQKNSLVENRVEGWHLLGLDNPEGVKIFYHLTVRDALVEANRIYALFLGQLGRTQEKWAQRWANLDWEESSKIFPLFEATLRKGELQFYKRIHEILPQMLGEGFQTAMRSSLVSVYTSLDELLNRCAWPWISFNVSQNGLLNYIDCLISFFNHLFEEILHWYQRKWRHFTLGPLVHTESTHEKE